MGTGYKQINGINSNNVALDYITRYSVLLDRWQLLYNLIDIFLKLVDFVLVMVFKKWFSFVHIDCRLFLLQFQSPTTVVIHYLEYYLSIT